MKKKLLIIQEILPSYRLAVFEQIAALSSFQVTVFSDIGTSDFGAVDTNDKKFKFIKANWVKCLGLFKQDRSILKLWRQNDVIFHVADFKFLTLWVVLFLSLFTRKKVFLHGQGGYKNNGVFYNIVYSLITLMCDGYICYTEYSRKAIKKKVPKFLYHKLSVCENTLDIVPLSSKPTIKPDNRVFYIGRLRTGCDIEVLLQACLNLSIHVEVIGAGDDDYLASLKQQYGEIATFYGAIFEENKQREIASCCMAGAYGGDAGLSVVHYMALGLPVIVHKEISKHMGPEPSYVIDGVNGLTFIRRDIADLTIKLTQLVDNNALRQQLSEAALNTFSELRKPSMAEKLVKIMRLNN